MAEKHEERLKFTNSPSLYGDEFSIERKYYCLFFFYYQSIASHTSCCFISLTSYSHHFLYGVLNVFKTSLIRI